MYSTIIALYRLPNNDYPIFRLNNYKSAHKSFKTKKRETQKLFHEHYMQDEHEGKDDWQFTLIDPCTTMLNLEKESFIGNIVLKRSFQMALMSVKNLVYNKLVRQNIFFLLY